MSCSFPLAPAFNGGITTLLTLSTVLCWEEAFSTYFSSLWRGNGFTLPREGLKLLSTSTFFSSLSIWNREDEGETTLSEFSESQQNVITTFFPLFLITGDFFEQPSYWFYGSLTSSFRLLFEAWPRCGSYFASNCLSCLINEVDDSQILPCFLRDLSFPHPKHFRTRVSGMTKWCGHYLSICICHWKTSPQFKIPSNMRCHLFIPGPRSLSSFHISVHSATTQW